MAEEKPCGWGRDHGSVDVFALGDVVVPGPAPHVLDDREGSPDA
jgi:hypothetical protein